jgi:hypothetical protein
MKKVLFSTLALIVLTTVSQAQFSAGFGGNYAKYGGEVGKAAPGIQIRGSYNFSEKKAVSLAATYGLPVKNTDSYEGTSVEQKTQFITLSLSAVYHLIGGYEDSFSLYIPVGASYVLANTKLSGSAADPQSGVATSEKFSGPTLNAGVGMQFKIGAPFLFAEAGFAIPANTTTNSRGEAVGTFENDIPSHSILTLGLKFPFGSSY